MLYLWTWVKRLRPPLTYSELHYWALLNRYNISGIEAEEMMSLDQIRHGR